jgi:hypothetical protein
LFEAPNGSGGSKQWSIGRDSRGIHTWYTEPHGSQLIYYHKPVNKDFNGSNIAAEEYMIKKVQEKEKKGYTDRGRFHFVPKTRSFK